VLQPTIEHAGCLFKASKNNVSRSFCFLADARRLPAAEGLAFESLLAEIFPALPEAAINQKIFTERGVLHL